MFCERIKIIWANGNSINFVFENYDSEDECPKLKSSLCTSALKTAAFDGGMECEGTAMNNGSGDDVDNLLCAINSVYSLCLHSP